MMRKGPLDRYPAESVLREAATARVNGGIEFHGPHPVTVYLSNGEVYAIHEGVGRAEQGWSATELAVEFGDEGTELARAVELLTAVLTQREGWYYHHPLHHHPHTHGWIWEVGALLRLARDRHRAEQPIARWSTGTVQLLDEETPRTPFPADPWAVVVALAAELDAAQLRHRLGWEPDRLASALDHLEAMGLIRLPGAPVPGQVPRLTRGLSPADTTVVPFPGGRTADPASAAGTADRAARLAALPSVDTTRRPPVPSEVMPRPAAVPVPTPSSEPVRVPGPLTPAFGRYVPPVEPEPEKGRKLGRRRKRDDRD